MSLTTIKQISLDMYNNNFVSINAKQYDTSSRFLEITCTENGKHIILNKNEIKAFVRYKKSDGKNVLNEAEILDDGKVKVELTQQMLAASGRCQAELMLVSSEGEIDVNDEQDVTITEGCILSTMYFYINVLPVSINEQEIESSYEYNALLNTISRIVVVEKELQENENERQEMENARVEAENSRQTNTTNAITACETATTNAINATSAANISATKANTATTKVNTAINNAEKATADANEATTSANNAANAANEAAELCQGIIDKSGVVMTTDIRNDLVATTTGKVLDAAQGKVLNDKIIALQEAINALPNILSGTSAPSNTLGKDGDIYMQIIES